MCLKPKSTFHLTILFILGGQSYCLKYQFVPENEDIFTDCPKQPSNVVNVHKLADLSETTFILNKDTIAISGNSTFIWNINPTDSIQVRFELLRYDRGSWFSTAFAIKTDDFCSVMFEKSQYWYNYWTRHITNVNEFGGKCPLNNPRTTIIHEPFDVDMSFDFASIVPLSGRYKIQMNFKAFDQRNVERNNRVCMDIIGEMIRAN